MTASLVFLAVLICILPSCRCHVPHVGLASRFFLLSSCSSQCCSFCRRGGGVVITLSPKPIFRHENFIWFACRRRRLRDAKIASLVCSGIKILLLLLHAWRWKRVIVCKVAVPAAAAVIDNDKWTAHVLSCCLRFPDRFTAYKFLTLINPSVYFKTAVFLVVGRILPCLKCSLVIARMTIKQYFSLF